MSFEARYEGICASCGEDIDPGDDVTYEDDELIHAECQTSWEDDQ